MKTEAIAMAGKTNPTNGTKIDGKYAALILIFIKYIYKHVYVYILTYKKLKIKNYLLNNS